MDDYHIAAAAATKILYPEQSAAFGGTEHQGSGNTSWHLPSDLKSKYVTQNSRFIPWFQPIALVLNSPWAKRQPPSAAASASELLEGGW